MNVSDLQEWNTYADLYDRNKGDSGDELSHQVDPTLLEFIGDVQERVVIDAGCGNGYLGALIAKRGPREVIAIDGSQALLRLGHRRFEESKVEFVHGDLMKPWPLGAGRADVVITNMVLQYVADVSTFATNAAIALAPGGTVVVSIDHPAHALVMRVARLAGIDNQKFLSDVPYLEMAQETIALG